MGELFIGESMITAHVILVYLIVQNFDGTQCYTLLAIVNILPVKL